MGRVGDWRRLPRGWDKCGYGWARRHRRDRTVRWPRSGLTLGTSRRRACLPAQDTYHSCLPSLGTGRSQLKHNATSLKYLHIFLIHKNPFLELNQKSIFPVIAFEHFRAMIYIYSSYQNYLNTSYFTIGAILYFVDKFYESFNFI